MSDITIYDEEEEITLVYRWDDKRGYSFAVTGYSSREEMHRAIKLSMRHWPKVPEHLRGDIDRNNREIVEFCRDVSKFHIE